MKTDKFLIGIVVGILLLVIAGVVLVLGRSRQEVYKPDHTPEGVAYNYFLAIQRKDFDKAYSYLSDDLKSKPDLDEFIQTVDNNYSEDSLTLGTTSLDGDRARIELSLTTYYGGGPFDSGRNYQKDVAYLKQNKQGEWKLTGYAYNYWGYNWNEEQK